MKSNKIVVVTVPGYLKAGQLAEIKDQVQNCITNGEPIVLSNGVKLEVHDIS